MSSQRTKGESDEPRFELLFEQKRQHAFVVPRCRDCGVSFWHPRPHCPKCLSTRLEIVEPAGPARVYSYTRNHRPQAGAADGPATLGYVEFAAGLRILVQLDLPDREDLTGIEVRPEMRSLDGSTHVVFVADEPSESRPGPVS